MFVYFNQQSVNAISASDSATGCHCAL